MTFFKSTALATAKAAKERMETLIVAMAPAGDDPADLMVAIDFASTAAVDSAAEKVRFAASVLEKEASGAEAAERILARDEKNAITTAVGFVAILETIAFLSTAALVAAEAENARSETLTSEIAAAGEEAAANVRAAATNLVKEASGDEAAERILARAEKKAIDAAVALAAIFEPMAFFSTAALVAVEAARARIETLIVEIVPRGDAAAALLVAIDLTSDAVEGLATKSVLAAANSLESEATGAVVAINILSAEAACTKVASGEETADRIALIDFKDVATDVDDAANVFSNAFSETIEAT